MFVMDRSYVIQLIIQKDLTDTVKLEEMLLMGFIGYKQMDNNYLLKKYNSQTEKPIDKIV